MNPIKPIHGKRYKTRDGRTGTYLGPGKHTYGQPYNAKRGVIKFDDGSAIWQWIDDDGFGAHANGLLSTNKYDLVKCLDETSDDLYVTVEMKAQLALEMLLSGEYELVKVNR